MNHFFHCNDLIAEYRLPRQVHDELFAEVIPVKKTDQGKPLYLEAHVDGTVVSWNLKVQVELKDHFTL